MILRASICRLSLATAAALALTCAAAPAQSPAPTGAQMRMPLQARHGSGMSGTVTIQPQGPAKTVISVNMFNSPSLRPVLTLHSGADCVDSAAASVRPIPLNPVSSGGVSKTIVSIPFRSLSSSRYVVDVRDATERSRFVQACARIGQ